MIAGSTRRILVVDDNLDGAEAMSIVLRVAGHEAHTANGAARRSGWRGPSSPM